MKNSAALAAWKGLVATFKVTVATVLKIQSMESLLWKAVLGRAGHCRNPSA